MNHGIQLGWEVDILDKNGRLRQKIANNEVIDYKYSVETTIKDKDGNIIDKDSFPFQSFNYNFLYLMAYNLVGTDNATTIKTTSNGADPSATCSTADVLAAATADTYGIQVGLNDYTSGYNPAIAVSGSSVGSWALRHKIAHGTTSGQLSYGAVTADSLDLSGGITSFSRSFTNSSGSSITVAEVGLVGKDNTSDYYLIARDTQEKDLTNISKTVADGQTLIVSYKMSIKSIFQATESSWASCFTDNLLRMLKSNLQNSAEYITKPDGLTTSLDFGANPEYMSVLATSGESTYGIMIAGAINSSSSVIALPLPVHTSDYTTSYKLSTSQFSYGTSTSTVIDQNQVSVMNPRELTGSSPWTVSTIRCGVQRDFQSLLTDPVALLKIYLLSAGSSSSTRFMIGTIMMNAGTIIDVSETVRVKLYMGLPHYMHSN